MCLIIALPRASSQADIKAALSALFDNWESNPDGAGFAYANRGRIVIHKPYWQRSRFLDVLERLLKRKNEDSGFIVHLRFATHGRRDARNTHPHMLANGRIALAHNGILSGYGSPDEVVDLPKASASFTRPGPLSDTVDFCQQMLRDASESTLTSPGVLATLGEHIGEFNKFALVDSEGELHIVNAKSGHYQGRVWYSTATHRDLFPWYRTSSAAGFEGGWRFDADEEGELETATLEAWLEKRVRERAARDAALDAVLGVDPEVLKPRELEQKRSEPGR